jgi:hypothetical protein
MAWSKSTTHQATWSDALVAITTFGPGGSRCSSSSVAHVCTYLVVQQVGTCRTQW